MNLIETTLRTVTKSPAQLMSSSIHFCDDHSLWRLSIKRDRQSIDREVIRFTTKHCVIDAQSLASDDQCRCQSLMVIVFDPIVI